jgi:anti-sigma regulatory factor (Ser/Thr protein kinase)
MRATRAFPASSGSVKKARHFIAQYLSDVAPDVVDDVTLVVSELATNAVRHASVDFVVAAERKNGRLRVAVTDGGGGSPHVRHPSSDEPSGRGLQIVEALSDDWGIDRGRRGTTVWFTAKLAARDRGSAGRRR